MKSKTTAKTEVDLKTTITTAYVDYVLKEGKNPISIYQFAHQAGITEGEFYTCFNNFEAVANEVWKSTLDTAFATLEGSPEYAGFSVREKCLLFYFTVVQEFKNQRSYVTFSSRNWLRPGKKDGLKTWVEKRLGTYFDSLIQEGFDKGELFNRTFISNYYKQALTLQFFLVLDFWVKDTSIDFEDTDAYIEKTVHLGFGMMQENTLDKAVDLARFMAGRVF